MYRLYYEVVAGQVIFSTRDLEMDKKKFVNIDIDTVSGHPAKVTFYQPPGNVPPVPIYSTLDVVPTLNPDR